MTALDLTLYEVTNVAVVRWQAPHIAVELIRLVGRTCGELLVRPDAELLRQTADLAAHDRLTAYDAAYIAAARHHGCQLVSCDLKDLVEPGFAVAPDAVV